MRRDALASECSKAFAQHPTDRAEYPFGQRRYLFGYRFGFGTNGNSPFRRWLRGVGGIQFVGDSVCLRCGLPQEIVRHCHAAIYGAFADDVIRMISRQIPFEKFIEIVPPGLAIIFTQYVHVIDVQIENSTCFDFVQEESFALTRCKA